MTTPKFLVFDIETAADGALISKLRYGSENLSPEDAIARFRQELWERQGSDFIPYPYQVPIAVAVAAVDSQYRLMRLTALDSPEFRPEKITEKFWRGWEMHNRPTWVSFNGKGFDLPVMELAAFRYGISVPGWFNIHDRHFEQSRYRYNQSSHFDLQDFLTNSGATRFSGGLNLAANILGKPGKMEVLGYMVQDLYNEGKVQEINEYCKCDTLDTYFVFLRTRLLSGDITLEQEHEIVAETKQWIIDQSQHDPAYQIYMQHWGDWQNPWEG